MKKLHLTTVGEKERVIKKNCVGAFARKFFVAPIFKDWNQIILARFANY